MPRQPRRHAAASARRGPDGGPDAGQGRAAAAGWCVWLPEGEPEAERSNACFGIAVAVALSLPIWIVVGVLVFALAG